MNTFLSEEQGIQDKLAFKYDKIAHRKFFQEYQNYWNKYLLKLAPENQNAFVLDCGCGIGKMLNVLSGVYSRAFGLDISQEVLKRASVSNSKAKVISSDVHNIGFKTNTFDLVLCKGSLHHLTDLDATFKEIRRILKKGGILIVSEPCRDNKFWRFLGLQFVEHNRKFCDQHKLFRKQELLNIFQKNNFEVLNSCKFGYAGFLLCALAYQFPLLNFLPCNLAISKFLVRTDEFMLKIPFLRNFNWHLITTLRKA